MIACIDDIFTPGAAYFLENRLICKDGDPAVGFPYVSLEEMFQPADTAACCSCYTVKDSSGEEFPWVRFKGVQARRESGLILQVEWLHLEFDLEKAPDTGQKVWPGVYQGRAGIWRATKQAETVGWEFVVTLTEQIPELVFADWYMSRGGLHILAPIEPISYESALAYVSEVVERATVVTREIASELQIPLSLDRSCAQPSRLMYLPQINKPGQGVLRLPHSGGTHGRQKIRLAEPKWLPDRKIRSGAPEKLNLPRDERRWMENFASRWLNSHLTWLASALPGMGRNERLYALGGDIRQLGDVGLLEDIQGWLDVAVETGLQAPLRPVHNTEQAVQNGYAHGSGTHTLAIGYADLQRYREGKERGRQMAKLLR